MKVLITGSTGFVGTGVLAACLESTSVTSVIAFGRRPPSMTHTKLSSIEIPDMGDLSTITPRLASVDACFWCLGISAAGVDEPTYTRITYDLTLHAAEVLSHANPEVAFCFLSGAGADGKAMWARTKRRTEDALAGTDLRKLVILRPAFIEDRHGAPRHGLVRYMYPLAALFSVLWRRAGRGTSNTEIGRAMIASIRRNVGSEPLDSSTINELAATIHSPSA